MKNYDERNEFDKDNKKPNKQKSPKNTKVRNAFIALVLAGATIVTGIVLVRNRKIDAKNVTFQTVIDAVKKDTSADEILGEQLISDTFGLESRLEYAKTIDTLGIYDDVKGLDPISTESIGEVENSTTNPTESVDDAEDLTTDPTESVEVNVIEAKIARLKELSEMDAVINDELSPEHREYMLLALELTSWSAQPITDVDCQIAEDALTCIIKSEVIDAAGIEVSEASAISLDLENYTITFTDPKTGHAYVLEVEESNPFTSVGVLRQSMETLKALQNINSNSKENANAEGKTEAINNALNCAKILLVGECEIKGNRIYFATPMPEARAAINNIGIVKNGDETTTAPTQKSIGSK